MLFIIPTLATLPRLSVPLYKQSSAPIERRVSDLVRRMTLPEKARQLDMYAGTAFVTSKLDDTHTAPDAKVNEAELEKALGNFGAGSIHDVYPTAEISNSIQKWVISHERLGIPALFIEEGVHGYLGFHETVYPCPINLASTFDPSLAETTAGQIASEARANGVDMLLGPVLDVAREPRWGRIEEDFGEDPYLSGRLGQFYVRGMQGTSLATDHTVISEPKHFAGHGSPEGGINTSPVHAGEREVRSIFLRSFEPAIRSSGALGIMAAYHEIDGVPCAGNPWLLNDVLRGEWGFKGFVLSDLGAISMLYSSHHVAATEADAARLAIRSGVDMQFYDFSHETFQNALIEGIKTGKLSTRDLDRAVSHVLYVKFELGLFDHPFVDPELHSRVSRRADHLKTALQSARESLCLLKNEGALLPLKPDVGTIAVIGPNAVTARTGDYTATRDLNPVSILAGVETLVGSQSKVVSDGGQQISRAVEVAKSADVVILGLGEREGISGEGSDRSNLNLPDNQIQLLRAVFATGKPCVLVLENGRPLTIDWASKHVPAIVEAWYPGEFGGTAIAEALFGKTDFTGHLPISFPSGVGTIPVFYNHDSSKGDHYVDGTAKPVWPFGFGLSYAEISFSDLKVVRKGGEFLVTVKVTNKGPRPGEAVAQLYERAETSSVATPSRSLKGFSRTPLQPGETKTVEFDLSRYELETWGAARRWSVEPGKYRIWVGDSSDAALTAEFTVQSGDTR